MLNHLESYSVILPTYNECGHIEDLTMDIFNIFKSKNLKFEIIIVDDESEDGTFEIVQNCSFLQILLLSFLVWHSKI